jgi:hypothetical protein
MCGLGEEIMGCRCPNCNKPKDCDEELCAMCELKEAVKKKVDKVFHRRGNDSDNTRSDNVRQILRRTEFNR